MIWEEGDFWWKAKLIHIPGKMRPLVANGQLASAQILMQNIPSTPCTRWPLGSFQRPAHVTTYDSSLRRCCPSSRRRRRTSRGWGCTSCCCTETVHPHTHPLLERSGDKGKGDQRPRGSATMWQIHWKVVPSVVQLSFANEWMNEWMPD